MTWLRTLASRLPALFRKQSLREEFDQELRLHLEMETEQNLRRGMSTEQADRAARLSLGGVDQAKEAWWDQRGLPALESLVQDLRYGLRALLRSPVYAAAAVLSLALGIGANTAMFTIIHALVLRPLPYPEPERLVNVWSAYTWQGSPTRASVSVPDLQDWRQQNDVFEEMAAYQAGGVNLTREGASVRLLAAHVEAGVFRVLGSGRAPLAPTRAWREPRGHRRDATGFQVPSALGYPVVDTPRFHGGSAERTRLALAERDLRPSPQVVSGHQRHPRSQRAILPRRDH